MKAQIKNDSVFYRHQQLQDSIPLYSVERIIVFGKAPVRAMIEQSGLYASLFALLSFARYENSKPTLRSVSIAALIGAPLGLLVGYGEREKENILVNNYSIVK